MYYLVLESLEKRTEVINSLKHEGINAVFHYVPLHSLAAGLKYGKCYGRLMVTNNISEKLLRLPHGLA